MLNKKIITIALSLAVSIPAYATEKNVKVLATPAFSASTDQALLKTFSYSPNKVFEIQSRVGMWTNITIPDGEVITGFLPSDTTFWNTKVTNDRKRVLMRPVEAGQFNSATIVTDKHTYELTFKSYGNGHSWYQRISWKFNDEADPAFGIFSGDAINLSKNGADTNTIKKPNLNTDKDPTNWDVDIAKAHFDYKIDNSSHADFSPIRVFDDGTFTYIQMPKTQDMPAIFALGNDDKVRLVDYVVKNNYILVQRVLPGLVLKLGEKEVVVHRNE